jgi:xylulokinase
VDLGTSGPKSALVSEAGQVADWCFERVPLLMTGGGGAEQDPNQWWGAVKKTAAMLLERNPGLRGSVAAVCCTGQWSGTVCVDEAGQALMNAVIWLDTRGSPYVREVIRGFPAVQGYGLRKLVKWLRATGGIPSLSGKDPFAHILFIRHERPEVYARTYRFLEPKDYINACFTGRQATSQECIALHWVTDNRDLEKVAYRPDLLRLAGLSEDKLPEIRRAVDVLGPVKPELAAELGLSPDVRVVMGAPDVQSAIIGSGAVLDYQAHLYIGTSSWLTCHVPGKKTSIASNMAALPAAFPDRYFIANEQETAGACLDYLKKNLFSDRAASAWGDGSAAAYEAMEAQAMRAPAGSGRVIFTPWLYGERTPVEDHTIRGGFYNLGLDTTRGQLIRAVYEGVAYNSRWLLEAVEKFTRRRLDTIRFIGGGAQSRFWARVHADVLGRRICCTGAPILANLRGAGLLAAYALGRVQAARIPELVRVEAEFEPDAASHEMYTELFGEFKEIYRINRKLYARLNRRRQADG